MPTDYKNLGNRPKGDPNILKVKDNNKVRPLDNQVAGWKQHAVEHPSDPEQFASFVCPGARSCPACRKPVDPSGRPYFQVSRRFASNVWDYESGAVKVLVGGPQIFDEFKSAATVGIDPSSCDWTIVKSGKDKGTKYDVIRHDAAPFTAGNVTPDDLHDIIKYEQPASTEAIFEIFEKFGIDYDALPIPSYTSTQALGFVMPYTKFKGMTVEQVLMQEQSFAEWLHGTKLEQGQLGDPVFLALQAALEDRGLVPALDEALAQIPDPEPAPAAPPTVTVTRPEPQVLPSVVAAGERLSPSSENLVRVVSPDGQEQMVPPTVVDTLLTAGFKRWEPPAPAAAEPATMTVLVGGNSVELPTEAARSLLASGQAQEVSVEPEASEPEPPKLPLPDEVIKVVIAGAPVDMPFAQAAATVDAGAATFWSAQLATTYDEHKARAAEVVAQSPTGTESSGTGSTTVAPAGATSGPKDAKKPFECDQCESAYKTQGALTNHKNRQHGGGAQPQPSAIPATSNGGGVSDRVKDKIARAPFARDFDTLLAIFEEETGKRNVKDMSEEELGKLESRIDREIAAATAN